MRFKINQTSKEVSLYELFLIKYKRLQNRKHTKIISREIYSDAHTPHCLVASDATDCVYAILALSP